MRAVALLVLALVVACGGGADPDGSSRGAGAAGADAATGADGAAAAPQRTGADGTPLTSAGIAHPLPAQAPDLFGFGVAASETRIARWDIDVKPDGEGLPPGRGSVAEGRRVYETHCVTCHGATGTEGPNDRLVGTEPWEEWPAGRAVGNYWPYATTLYDYVSKAMPQATPGVLTADETYAVTAYVLHLNGLVGDDAVMDATTLPAVEMPARDRFVRDDRTGGPVVR